MGRLIGNKKGGSRLYFEDKWNLLKSRRSARASTFYPYSSNLLKSKRSFEMTFAWIFAIIAGSVIILLAIYATTRFVQTAQYTQYSESAKSLGNLLNPVVSGIASAYATSMDFKKETRIYMGCSNQSLVSPVFGRQTIAFSEESGFLSKWTAPGANISRHNKYIFSESVMQGKKLFVFSKPFYLGYKVDDLIFLSMDNYCFTGQIPGSVRDEIMGLGLKNVNITATLKLCPRNSNKVCFGFNMQGCNSSVSGECQENYCRDEYETGTVRKAESGAALAYAGSSLMYAAIFSSPEIYSCNVQRLGKKAAELGKVYNDKAGLLRAKNCNSLISTQIVQITALSEKLTPSKLADIYYQAELMDERNCEDVLCRVYAPENC